jgi:hypothetical protein
LRQTLCAQPASSLDGIFPFAGANCERLTKAVLERLGLSAQGDPLVPDRDRLAPLVASPPVMQNERIP